MVSPGAVLQERDAGPSNSISNYRNGVICSDANEPELASFAVDRGAKSPVLWSANMRRVRRREPVSARKKSSIEDDSDPDQTYDESHDRYRRIHSDMG